MNREHSLIKKGWDEYCGIYKCSDGIHFSWWQAMVGTPEWKAWDKFNRGKHAKYDIAEVAGCGWMSEQHAKDFFIFIRTLPVEQGKNNELNQ